MSGPQASTCSKLHRPYRWHSVCKSLRTYLTCWSLRSDAHDDICPLLDSQRLFRGGWRLGRFSSFHLLCLMSLTVRVWALPELLDGFLLSSSHWHTRCSRVCRCKMGRLELIKNCFWLALEIPKHRLDRTWSSFFLSADVEVYSSHEREDDRHPTFTPHT